MKLNIAAFALAFGLWWGGGLFIATWWLIGVGAEPDAAALLGRVYVGYALTPLGSVIGLAWGLVCGTICGAILAWLYNLLAERVGAGILGRSN